MTAPLHTHNKLMILPEEMIKLPDGLELGIVDWFPRCFLDSTGIVSVTFTALIVNSADYTKEPPFDLVGDYDMGDGRILSIWNTELFSVESGPDESWIVARYSISANITEQI